MAFIYTLKVFNTLTVVKTEIKRLKMHYFKKYTDLNMQKMCSPLNTKNILLL